MAWRKFNPPPDDTPDLEPRTWTSKQDGRTFTGALMTTDAASAVIRRTSDNVIFNVPLANLTETDQAYVRTQLTRAAKSNRPLGAELHTLSRKLEIKGNLVRVAITAADGGFRMDRTDPMYWLLLTPGLQADASTAIWVRVDEKTFRASSENSLISREHHLPHCIDQSGAFIESMPWPRPQFTIREARYGANVTSPSYSTRTGSATAGNLDVTHRLMSLISQGNIPLEVSPEHFGCGNGELAVLWKTPAGEIRQVLRAGSILTWPVR